MIIVTNSFYNLLFRSFKLSASVLANVQVFRGLEEAIVANRGVPLIETQPFNENVIYAAYGKVGSRFDLR